MNGTQWSGATEWRPVHYRAANLRFLDLTPYVHPDWYVAYDFSGTNLERANVDAATLINEAIANVIIGNRPLEDWSDIVAEYRKMYADEFIRVATEQYAAYK